MRLIRDYTTAHGIVQRTPEPPDSGAQIIVLFDNLDNYVQIPEVPFLLAVYPAREEATPNINNAEIMRCVSIQDTGVGTYLLTVDRVYEGTLNRSIQINDQILCEVSYNDLVEYDNAIMPVSRALRLETARKIDGVLFDGTQDITIYNQIVRTLSDLENLIGLLHNDGNGNLSWSTIKTEDVEDKNITFAKIQDIETNRLLGRSSSGVGIIEELTASAIKSMLGYYTSGDNPTFGTVIVSNLIGDGLTLPHVVKKVASSNVRNSHDAEVYVLSTNYVKVKTITFVNGLVGQARFLFDLRTEYGAGDTAYGVLTRNNTSSTYDPEKKIGNEQTTTSSTYQTKSQDITQTFNPGDTVELWLKNIYQATTTYARNFRIAYDNSTDATVTTSNS